MKTTKRQLRKIIREESRRIMEDCGGDMHGTPALAIEPAHVADVTDAVGALSESETPEGELVVEMEMASRNLELVVESINAAAALCPDCVQEVAAAGPLIDAMVSQASALQETLEAVETVVTENTELSFSGDMAELPGDEAFGGGYEAGKLDLS
jgi:hypothetical protein|tara:strand:+ start:1296 stop:1757 length:462 start_codon:yes stop_codon:yes gene_type:complete